MMKQLGIVFYEPVGRSLFLFIPRHRGKFVETFNEVVEIEGLLPFQHVEDFGRDHTSDQSLRLVFSVTGFNETFEGLLCLGGSLLRSWLSTTSMIAACKWGLVSDFGISYSCYPSQGWRIEVIR